MKISDAVAQAKANGHRITENNSNDEFTKSEFYIRIGQDVLNQETDSMDFISLPQPLYLDSMRKNRGGTLKKVSLKTVCLKTGGKILLPLEEHTLKPTDLSTNGLCLCSI